MQQDASSPMATVGAETLQRDASAWQAAASDSATPPAPQAPLQAACFEDSLTESLSMMHAVSVAVDGGRRRAMQQDLDAASPMVTVGQEQFRDASTWATVISNITSSAAAYEVHGYGGVLQPM